MRVVVVFVENILNIGIESTLQKYFSVTGNMLPYIPSFNNNKSSVVPGGTQTLTVSDTDDSRSAFQLKQCFSNWMTEWQWNNQVVLSPIDTAQHMNDFHPHKTKQPFEKMLWKRLMAWNPAGGGKNIRKILHDIVIQDNSTSLIFLLFWSSWYQFFYCIRKFQIAGNFVALSYYILG